MSVYATPVTLTDASVLFADLAAANAFFAQFELPPATDSVAGIVKMAALPVSPAPAAASKVDSFAYKIADENGATLRYDLCTQSAYEDLVDKYNTLQAHYEELLAKLISAGLVSPV